MSEQQMSKERLLAEQAPQLFDDATAAMIHDLLRGFRKGYGVRLEDWLDDCYENDLDTQKRVIWELCQISGDTFDEVCVWRQWKEADLPYARTEDQGHSPVEPLP